ncbi:hypothetical protein SteCoe_34472 [Stentor coeruleus]|uniref:Uncharacterized protein n=1 Tax=Stentor coeruleus TaxID=5963 RepID=A0A1R2AUM4_9CILI|nr:hypothetical protein SteCoe_34472 [Stentor coeruleus]
MMTLKEYKNKLQDFIDRKQFDKADSALKILNNIDVEITTIHSDEEDRQERVFKYLRDQLRNLGYTPRDSMLLADEYGVFNEEPLDQVIERIKQDPRYIRENRD